MSDGHMTCNGGGARVILSGVAAYALVVEVNLNQLIFGMQFQLLTYQVVRHRVKVLIVLYMVIDIHLDGFNIGIVISLPGQRRQGGFIQRLEPLLPRAFKLLEGFIIHVNQQDFNTHVEFGQREECLVP